MHSLKYITLLSLLGVVVVTGKSSTKRTMMSQLKSRNQKDQCITVPGSISNQSQQQSPQVQLYVYNESTQQYYHVRSTSPTIQTYYVLDEATGQFNLYQPTVTQSQQQQVRQTQQQQEQQFSELPKCDSIPQEVVDQFVQVDSPPTQVLQTSTPTIDLYVQNPITGDFTQVGQPSGQYQQYYTQNQQTGTFEPYVPHITTQFSASGTPLFDLYVQDSSSGQFYPVSEPSGTHQNYYTYDESSGYFFPYQSDVPLYQTQVPQIQLYSFNPQSQTYEEVDHTTPDIETYYIQDESSPSGFVTYQPESPSQEPTLPIDLYIQDYSTGQYVYIDQQIPQITEYFTYNQATNTFEPFQPTELPKCETSTVPGVDVYVPGQDIYVPGTDVYVPEVTLYDFNPSTGNFEEFTGDSTVPGQKLFSYDESEESFKPYIPTLPGDQTQTYGYDEYTGTFYQLTELTPQSPNIYIYDQQSGLYIPTEDCEELTTDLIPSVTQQQQQQSSVIPSIPTFVQDSSSGTFIQVTDLPSQQSDSLFYYNTQSGSFEPYLPSPQIGVDVDGSTYVQLYTQEVEGSFTTVVDQGLPADTYYYYDEPSQTFHEYVPTNPLQQSSGDITIYTFDESSASFTPAQIPSSVDTDAFYYDEPSQLYFDYQPTPVINLPTTEVPDLYVYDEPTGTIYYVDDQTDQFENYYYYDTDSSNYYLYQEPTPYISIYVHDEETGNFYLTTEPTQQQVYYFDQPSHSYFEYTPEQPEFPTLFTYDQGTQDFVELTPGDILTEEETYYFYDELTSNYYQYSFEEPEEETIPGIKVDDYVVPPTAPTNSQLYFFDSCLEEFYPIDEVSPYVDKYYFYDQSADRFFLHEVALEYPAQYYYLDQHTDSFYPLNVPSHDLEPYYFYDQVTGDFFELKSPQSNCECDTDYHYGDDSESLPTEESEEEEHSHKIGKKYLDETEEGSVLDRIRRVKDGDSYYEVREYGRKGNNEWDFDIEEDLPDCDQTSYYEEDGWTYEVLGFKDE